MSQAEDKLSDVPGAAVDEDLADVAQDENDSVVDEDVELDADAEDDLDDVEDVTEGDDPVSPGDADEPSVSAVDLEQEGEIAADYVEGLLDIADLDGDIDMDVEGNRAVVSVVGATLDELVGRRGEVLAALQELTEVGRDAAEEVKRTGTPKHLAAMTPFERKIVHGAVADAGLRSESEGEEPSRRVVVYPAE